VRMWKCMCGAPARPIKNQQNNQFLPKISIYYPIFSFLRYQKL
jgi:hypothetical protein